MPLAKARIAFLHQALAQRLTKARMCPYCREPTPLTSLGRKRLIIEVLRCERCLLVFRYPPDDPRLSVRYYDSAYEAAAVTCVPEQVELAHWCNASFRGTPVDLTSKIDVLKAIRPLGKVLDYGCSWGYGVFQLAVRGYDAVGFEISKRRAELGRNKLKVTIIDNLVELKAIGRGAFDVVFGNHVIEHLPDLAESLDTFAHVLKDDGLIFQVLPNFTGRTARGGAFWNWIGRDHPIAPTAAFLGRNLHRHGFRDVAIASGPFDEGLVEAARSGAWAGCDTEGDELLVIAWRTPRGGG
ncbi:MAG TPA: class I SAM-dependent methyltransferase [Vicinamibacterales bacterium]|nr:class I SAM-dependent methyltransferase [Vicinamibacterales bacterium]